MAAVDSKPKSPRIERLVIFAVGLGIGGTLGWVLRPASPAPSVNDAALSNLDLLGEADASEATAELDAAIAGAEPEALPASGPRGTEPTDASIEEMSDRELSALKTMILPLLTEQDIASWHASRNAKAEEAPRN